MHLMSQVDCTSRVQLTLNSNIISETAVSYGNMIHRYLFNALALMKCMSTWDIHLVQIPQMQLLLED